MSNIAKECIQIDGVAELLAKLQSLGVNTDKAIHEGLMKAAAVVQRTAKKMCPVDSGELRRSIKVISKEPLVVIVSTNNEYAVYVEFGTGTKGDPAVQHVNKAEWWIPADRVDPDVVEKYHLMKWSTSEEEGGKEFVRFLAQEPQPFMSPAAALSEEKIKKRVAASLKKLLKEVCGNG